MVLSLAAVVPLVVAGPASPAGALAPPPTRVFGPSLAGPASAVRVEPQAMVVAGGSVYFVDRTLRRYDPDTGQVYDLLANLYRWTFGPGASGFSGSLDGVAVEGSGTVLVTSGSDHLVYRVDPSLETITVVAGTGTAGFSGDGGPATAAQLDRPRGVAVAPDGSIYVADSNNHRVRRVAPDGSISTFAGGGVALGDGGPATLAALQHPVGLAVNGSDIYLADMVGCRVRRISAGTISTVVGTGVCGSLGDGGAATAARVNQPVAVAVAADGTVWVAEVSGNRVRVISAGIISTFAGTGISGFSGDGGLASSAKIAIPWGVATDGGGTVYLGDSGNDRLRAVTGGTITTVAGVGVTGVAGQGQPLAQADLEPTDVAFNPAGDTYIAEYTSVLKASHDTGVVTRVAGTGVPGSTGDGGAATSATLYGVSGVVTDSAGNLFVAEGVGHRIRKVTPAGTITTYAGNGFAGATGDGGNRLLAKVDGPTGLVIDAAGNLYFADPPQHRVRRITPSGVISTIAGTGSAGSTGDGGPATAAQLDGPTDVAVDSSGNVYIADGTAGRIRMVDPTGTISTVTTVGGGGVAVLPTGDLLVIASTGSLVRRSSLSGATTEVLAPVRTGRVDPSTAPTVSFSNVVVRGADAYVLSPSSFYRVSGIGGSHTVTTTSDLPDAAPGDGTCAVVGGGCSLRAAIQEANAARDGRPIVLASGAHYTLARAGIGEDAAATGDLDVTGPVRIEGNGATVDGGTIDRVFEVRGGRLEADHLTITGGRAMTAADFTLGIGGGVLVRSGGLDLRSVTVTGNSSFFGGGVAVLDGMVTLRPVTLSANTSYFGGGLLALGGTFDLTGIQITGNDSLSSGGGVWATVPLTFGGARITGNHAVRYAGGIGSGAVLTLSTSTVADNTAEVGGGLVSASYLSMDRTTVSGNTATATGGGLATGAGAYVTLSTISSNGAPVGGGIWAAGATYGVTSAVTLTSTTITANHGGGLVMDTGAWAEATNTLIGAQASGADCSAPITSHGFDAASDGSCAFVPGTPYAGLSGSAGISDHDAVAPGLGPLADNGGPNLTHYPPTGSPVIGIGMCYLGNDQRGVPRNFYVGGLCSVGAVENR